MQLYGLLINDRTKKYLSSSSSTTTTTTSTFALLFLITILLPSTSTSFTSSSSSYHPPVSLSVAATTERTTMNNRLVPSVASAANNVSSKSTSKSTSTSSSSSSSLRMATITTNNNNINPKRMKVAVIGAGAAGLAATRVLTRNGIEDTVVFEKDTFVGGIWHYSSTNNNNNNKNNKDSSVSSSSSSSSSSTTSRPMYRGLRTNLPKEVMQYREYPWMKTTAWPSSRPNAAHEEATATTTTTSTTISQSKVSDDGSYLSHYNVVEYLRQYEKHFNLTKYISFGCTVQQLTVLTNKNNNNTDDHYDTVVSMVSPPNEKWPKIRLDWHSHDSDDTLTNQGQSSSSSSSSDIFDAVFICNGHYAVPSYPTIPGLHNFRGTRVIHSVDYDDPTEFTNQVVLCIGGRASGSDLAREISFHANHVYLSDTTCVEPIDIITPPPSSSTTSSSTTTTSSTKGPSIVTWVPKTTRILPDGTIQFGDDDNAHYYCPKNVDTIIFCSGYDYSFPFINEQSNIPSFKAIMGERRVTPLYRQLWHAEYPNLAFVGLPHSVVPFPLMELQAEAVCKQWIMNFHQQDNDTCNNEMTTTTTTAVPSQQYVALPIAKERMVDAERDAISGGAKGPTDGRVQDTHFLGDLQWDYCREMAKLAGLYDDEMESYIAMNKAIYDYAGKTRKESMPGGPDTYRNLVFHRDQSNRKFDVVDECPTDCNAATGPDYKTTSVSVAK